MQFSRTSMIETTSSRPLIVLNSVYPYIYGIIGSLLNLILIITFCKRKNKTYQKYTLPCISVMFQLNLIAFVIANIKSSSSHIALINSSSYSCKTLSFIIYVTSSLINWIFSMGPYVVKCYIKRNVKNLERMFKVYFIFTLISASVYSINIIYLNLNTFVVNQTINGYNSSCDRKEVKICSFKDMRLLLLRDFLDFLYSLLLPFLILTYNAIKLRPMQKLKVYPRIKCVFQSVFMLIFAPNILFALLNDVQLYFYESNVTHMWLEYAFTFGLLMHYSFIIGASIIQIYFYTKTKILFYKIFCFPCYLVNIMFELEKKGEEKSIFHNLEE
jgi:hypothetical protein